MPLLPANSAWDEPSLHRALEHAAVIASRLVSGFAGVAWFTKRDGQPGEWLIAAGAAPLWHPAGSTSPHPWARHEPLFRVPVPGAASLTLAAASHDCPDALLEIAALLSAGLLTTSAPRLRQILESTHDGVFLLDRDWRFTYFNRRGAALLSRTPDSLLGRNIWDCFPEAAGSQFQNVYERVLSTGEPESAEGFFAPLDAWLQADAFISGNELAVFFRDVTHQHRERERRQATEAELRRALERLHQITDESQDIICTWDAGGHFQTVNLAAKRILGYEPDELRGTHFAALAHPDDRELSREAARSILSGKRLGSFLNRARHKDGRIVHLEWSAVWSAAENVGFAVARDISVQEEAAQLLRDSEERYRLIFDQNPQQMWMYDDETYRMLAVNRAALANYGYSHEEFLQLTVFDLVHPDELELARSRLIANRQPGPRSGQWLHRHKDGTPIVIQGWSHPMSFRGRPTRLSVAIDITRQRSLEEQLRQAQKMEAVGELAGGIAHDFNNLLTVINGYAGMCKNAAAGTPLEPMLSSIEQAGNRAALLTQQLLAFSRRQVLQPELIQLNDVVTGMESMLRRLYLASIELTFDLAPNLALIRADAAQLEHVLLNLVLNARDAMQHRQGYVSIETTNVFLHGDYCATHAEAVPGPHILLTVTDSGHGMDAATAARIFEPFFTTKVRGRGTGLGLSMSYGIVRQSGGHMGVYSEPGVGTTMKVYLPAAQTSEEEALAADGPEAAAAPRGWETILLVEDDERVRRFTRTVLEDSGYSVIEAEDGHAALEVSASTPDHIHLLLTDVVLPRLGGREAAQRLGPRRPDMKVLFVSGYTENAIVHHGVLDAGLNFLAKPFTPESLARKVREVLDLPVRPRCVLIAAPSGPQRDGLNTLLGEAGYVTILAASSAEILKLTRRRAVDLIVSPLELPGFTPAEALDFFRNEFPHIRVAALGEPNPALRPDTFIPANATGGRFLEAVRGLAG